MVRFKHRWILFQVNQDPVIENGQIVYPRTSLRLNDQMISRAIYNQIEIYYGQFGKGLGSVAVKWYNPDTRIGIMRIPRDYTNMYLSTMFYMNKTAAIEWDRTYYIREQEEAEKKGQHYSSAEKIEASKKQITSIS
ncbi:hypothetical protein G6F70_000803 [Rhizopus microsporus]|nr:hypothetical protein G6F71_007337 [Rhizopus microsporus]KAG1204055.1 hypothetical protein G6F70_000803 [Rhizopus microsporus]KAG1208349.1 hypothetical protein G6F69_007292 [Rhizopus microsporus]KAG1237021.1 hypothetical protein G6F67_001509 [Rhizopus microsporus]KAG1261679.1 hypothetical protein G6F68_006514 [Rhizopus microsporus]